jgi:hypothetical protein
MNDNMIKAVELVMNTLETIKMKVIALKPGKYSSRIGEITIYSDEDFDKLSGNEIQKITKNIVDQTMDRYFGVNKAPIYVLSFKDAVKYNIPCIENKNTIGSTSILFSSNKLKKHVDINKIKSFSDMNDIENNEQNIGELLKLYFNNVTKIPNKELKSEGTLILMDANISKLYNININFGVLSSLLTKSVFYYSYVVHETIHNLQFNDVKNDPNAADIMTQGNYDPLNEGKGSTPEEIIKRNEIYRIQSYLLNPMEAEAMSEQRNFISSIKQNKSMEKYVKSALKSVGLIYDV